MHGDGMNDPGFQGREQRGSETWLWASSRAPVQASVVIETVGSNWRTFWTRPFSISTTKVDDFSILQFLRAYLWGQEMPCMWKAGMKQKRKKKEKKSEARKLYFKFFHLLLSIVAFIFWNYIVITSFTSFPPLFSPSSLYPSLSSSF